jgi:ferric-dicitrate binding protein FerR (iron transport regulator)
MDDRVSSVRGLFPADRDERAELSELGSEVASALDKARAKDADERIARVRARLASNQPSRFPKPIAEGKRPLALPISLAFAATLALVIGWAAIKDNARSADAKAPVAATPAIAFTVNDAPGSTGSFIAAKAETPVNFTDGSELRLAPAARVRVTEVANNGARVLVEDGSMHVAVVHREDTRWAIEAGPYEVRVTGTKFVVAWNAAKSALVVKMEEGSVVVGGCGLAQGTRLKGGEELTVACEKDKVSTVELPSPSAESSAEPAPVAPKPKPIDPTRAIVALAQKGQHAEAIEAAEANGWDNTLAALSGPELLLLANAGRYAGRFELASAALETTRRRFPDSDSAATAAFELGRIAMDVKHQLGPAGDDFELYLRERPSGPFAREALGRAIEARNGAGDSDRAQRLAVRYLATWPDGPHAALAKRVTGGTK